MIITIQYLQVNLLASQVTPEALKRLLSLFVLVSEITENNISDMDYHDTLKTFGKDILLQPLPILLEYNCRI
jgi:hypothetical protein